MKGGSAAPSGVYSFPLLKPRDIFACLREMRVPVAEEEVRSCDAAAVRKVLEAFLESAMGVTREELQQPAFTGLSALSFPELHADSIPELSFFRASQRLLAACGVDDFGLQDLLAPSPKRVRRQLSALINFAKFREERLAAFSELTGRTDALLQRKTTLQEQNAALQRELDALLQEQETEAPAKRQLGGEVEALVKEINGLNQRQAVLRHEAKTLKEARQSREDDVASARFNVLEAAKEIERLNGQIVTSPERVKKELRGIAEALEGAKGELHEMEREYGKLLAHSDTYERAEKDLAKTFALLDEVEREIQTCKDGKNKVKNAKQRIADLQRQSAETVKRRKRLEKLVALKKGELERYQQEAQIKESGADAALKVASAELRKLEAVHKVARQRIEQHTDASREIERHMKEDELQYQKELSDLQQVRGEARLGRGGMWRLTGFVVAVQMYSRLQLAAEYYNSQVLEPIRLNP
ncbi:hypothetical protein BBJ28_00022316 [Nothophytophthora sp. Chile5]|nr:hypothetical protein BBJ28_00022316 [Nothophytophthora sp. Chile5]